MSGSPICLVCGGTNDRDTLNCFSCWKKHDGKAIASELQGKDKKGLAASYAATMRLLEKHGNSPKPATRLKLCYVASTLVSEHNEWNPRNKLVAAYHADWSDGSPPTRAKPSAAKPSAPKARATLPNPSRKFSSIEEELQAICDGRHSPQVPDYKGMRQDAQPTKQTRSGHYVRSHEEKRVADFLWKQRVCFAYEIPVTIGEGVLHPDFIIPEQQGPDVARTLILEHFGRLDSDKYQRTAIAKLVVLRKLCDKHKWDLAFTTPDTLANDATVERFLRQFIKGLDTAHHII